MKMTFGVVLLVLSAVLGIYVGFWLMFIGGIVQFVNAVQMHPVPGMDIAIAVTRIIGAVFAGFLSFGIIFSAGLSLIKSAVLSKYVHRS
jgi:hypothetical protein